MADQLGSFVFVLHTHLPYVRRAGRWPHGEEMVHEAMAETYIPLLNALYDLVEEGEQPRLTIGLTPILLEQIADATVCDHFDAYLATRLSLIEANIARFERSVLAEWQAAHDAAAARRQEALQQRRQELLERFAEEGAEEDDPEVMQALQALEDDPTLPPPPIPVDPQVAEMAQKQRDHLLYLARWYRDWYRDIQRSFHERYGRDLVGAFRHLQEMGVLDVLTSMATHCYTPLVERDSTIYAQLRAGIETTRRHMGQFPRGIWLPECGYRPAYVKEGDPSYVKPGIEEFLAEFNIRYFFTDTHVIEGGELVGKAMGDAIGPYGAIPVRRLVIHQYDRPRARVGTTFRPYYVHGVEVAVFGRDERTGLQVWSATHGYPGDFRYREFHRKDDESGLQFWRITGSKVDLGHKELYDPYPAFQLVHVHADHFVDVVRGRLAEYRARSGEPGVVVSAYDTELFGHWWFEGIAWLKEVLRRLSRHPEVELTTARAYLEAHPPEEVLDIPESSWGNGGGHWTWLNPDTEWMWPLIHAAERTMEELVERYESAEGEMAATLNQAARELLLLESSDWPFLVTTGQAKEYAIGRFQGHLSRFNHLVNIARRGYLNDEDRAFLREAQELDNPFPTVDYRTFRAREPRA
jgi:1,4-alpha-glucan branching enzyme